MSLVSEPARRDRRVHGEPFPVAVLALPASPRILARDGLAPSIRSAARVAPNAVLSGDITVGVNYSIGFGTVLAAESGPITLGENVVYR